MIYNELINLQNYTNAEIGYNCFFGSREPGVGEYPVIRYKTDSSNHYKINVKLTFPVINVIAEIIVQNDNEIKGWEVYEMWLKKIHQFNIQYGHRLLEEFEIERDENKFIIRNIIELRTYVQDTDEN